MANLIFFEVEVDVEMFEAVEGATVNEDDDPEPIAPTNPIVLLPADAVAAAGGGRAQAETDGTVLPVFVVVVEEADGTVLEDPAGAAAAATVDAAGQSVVLVKGDGAAVTDFQTGFEESLWVDVDVDVDEADAPELGNLVGAFDDGVSLLMVLCSNPLDVTSTLL